MNKTKGCIVYICVILVVVLGLSEAISFIYWETQTKKEIKNNIFALCGQIFNKPTVLPNTFWHHELNPEHEKYKGLVNSKGTKGGDFQIPKPERELRIICIGDSTVEGVGVEPDQTYPHFLQEMMSKYIVNHSYYEKVKVINAGIGSHNSAFNLSYLVFRLINYEPDIVVIKSTYNDYLPYCVTEMKYDYTHAFPHPFHFQRSCSIYWFVARYSYLLKLWGSVFFHEEVVNPFEDFSGNIEEKQLKKMDYSDNEDKFYIYAEYIRSMILVCKGREIDTLVLDLPTSPDMAHYGEDKVFSENYRGLIGRLVSELKRIAREEKVPFINTDHMEEKDFWDHCHNTESGNRKIAENVYKALIKYYLK